jgi:hypothetical protein
MNRYELIIEVRVHNLVAPKTSISPGYEFT